MQPELTQELKKVFFAQYYGQEILKYRTFESPVFVLGNGIASAGVESSYIQLRDLRNITDREVVDVAKAAMDLLWISPNKMYYIIERDKHQIIVKEKYSTRKFCLDILDGQILTYEADNDKYDELSPCGNIIWATQVLLKMGFALPYMGYEVKELIKIGWVKFKEETELGQ